MDSSQYATIGHWIMVFCTLLETTVVYKEASLDSLTVIFFLCYNFHIQESGYSENRILF